MIGFIKQPENCPDITLSVLRKLFAKRGAPAKQRFSVMGIRHRAAREFSPASNMRRFIFKLRESEGSARANWRHTKSTAYYAMFHSLARTSANMLIGQKHTEAWHQVYRALEHGNARSACLNKQAMQGFPPAIQGFAEKFVSLQKKRHQADCSENNYDRKGTLAAIDRAEKAISQLAEASTVAASPPICYSSGGNRRRSNMDEQQIREIAKDAFKAQFSDFKIVRIDVVPRIDHDEDRVVDVRIFYDGNYKKVNSEKLSQVHSVIVSKAWREVEDDIGFPLIHFFPKSFLKHYDSAA